MRIRIWQVLLFVGLIAFATWLVFPGPRDMAGIYTQDNKRAQAQSVLEGLLAKNPDDPDLNQSLAELLYENGEMDRALKYLREVVRLRPGRVEQLVRLADWQEGLGFPQESASTLEEALRRLPPADGRKPDTVAARRNVLRKLLDFATYDDRLDQQEAYVRQLLPLDRLAMAGLLGAHKDLASGLDVLDRVAGAPRAKSDEMARQAALIGLYANFQKYAEDLVNNEAGPERPGIFMADELDALVRGELADEALRFAADSDRRDRGVKMRLMAAQIFINYGDAAIGEREMEKLLAERPGDAAILAALAQQRLAAGDAEGAVRRYRELAKLAPADDGVKRRLASALLQAKQTAEAFAVLAPLAVDSVESALLLLDAAEETGQAESVAGAARSIGPLAERDASVGMRLADAWSGVNRPGEAWSILRALAAKPGSDLLILHRAIAAAGASNDPSVVRDILAFSARAETSDPSALLEISAILEGRNENTGAARLLERYLAKSPGDRKAVLHLAELHSWRGAPDSAYAVIAGLLRRNPADTALLRKAAVYAEESGKDADAFRHYAELRRLYPKDKAVRAAYLRLAEWTGNTAGAAALLAEESNRDQRDVAKARQAADAYLAADVPKAALPFLERAAALAPGDVALRRSLADTLGALGFVDRQAAALEPLAAKGVLTRDESVLVAGRRLERKQPTKAVALLQRYEAETPLPWDAGTLLVQAYSQLNRQDEAYRLTRRLKDDYRNQPARLSSIGDLAVMIKRLDFALECYDLALRTDPRNASAIKGKAQVFAWNNDSARAIEGFESYRAKKPEDIEARYQLGELYHGTARPEEAAGEYRKTLRLIRETRRASMAARQQPATTTAVQ